MKFVIIIVLVAALHVVGFYFLSADSIKISSSDPTPKTIVKPARKMKLSDLSMDNVLKQSALNSYRDFFLQISYMQK